MKKHIPKPEEVELEYYDLIQDTTDNNERDHFFDTLIEEESMDESLISNDPPVRLDRFYNDQDSNGDRNP